MDDTVARSPLVAELADLIRRRCSAREPFDPDRRVNEPDLLRILEAAQWAPTAHNMQNFEIVVIDDRAVLKTIGTVRTVPSEIFLRENYLQLSFSEEELLRRRTGLLAEMFPPQWRVPHCVRRGASRSVRSAREIPGCAGWWR